MPSALELSGERQMLLERLLRKKGVETGPPASRDGSGSAEVLS